MQVSRALVEGRLAACVNIVPRVRSIYPWKGTIEDASEWMLIIKSSREHFSQLVTELRRAHSYDVPEVLAIPVVDGNHDYLDWMDREMSTK